MNLHHLDFHGKFTRKIDHDSYKGNKKVRKCSLCRFRTELFFLRFRKRSIKCFYFLFLYVDSDKLCMHTYAWELSRLLNFKNFKTLDVLSGNGSLEHNCSSKSAVWCLTFYSTYLSVSMLVSLREFLFLLVATHRPTDLTT